MADTPRIWPRKYLPLKFSKDRPQVNEDHARSTLVALNPSARYPEEVVVQQVNTLKQERETLNAWASDMIKRDLAQEAQRLGLTLPDGQLVETFNDVKKAFGEIPYDASQQGELQDKQEQLFSGFAGKSVDIMYQQKYMAENTIQYMVTRSDDGSSSKPGCISKIINKKKHDIFDKIRDHSMRNLGWKVILRKPRSSEREKYDVAEESNERSVLFRRDFVPPEPSIIAAPAPEVSPVVIPAEERELYEEFKRQLALQQMRGEESAYMYRDDESTTQHSRTTGPYGEEEIEEDVDLEMGVADTAIVATTKPVERKYSHLDRHSDPFAPREGKTLTWRNVNMVLDKGTTYERKLLEDVWGEVPQKETTAIMGPSGAGKSSLLNILSGRAASKGRLTIDSDIRLDNYSVTPTKLEVRKQIAFVAQDDSLQVTATPRESIRFSAKLRLPRSTTEHELDKLTERMLTELGLVTCADTIVGGALIKGISGGERKRTSVGVELVVKPALVFLDEPTSGLDSFSAVQLCQVLKKVANAGASVLFTIHQPSSEIFNSFDHLILMNKGRVMYQGSVQNVATFFGNCGHPNPPNFNPADWIMNVAQSVDEKQLDDDGFFPKDNRPMLEAFEAEDGKDALGITVTGYFDSQEGYDERPVGIGTEIRMLCVREMRNLRRDTVALASRFGITIFLGVLIGVIFLNVAETDRTVISNVQSTFGALIMVMMMGMFGTAQPALLSFPEERPVFLREYSTNHYSVVSYFVSRLTMEAFITVLQILVMLVITYFMIGFQSSFGILLAITYMLAMASTALAVALGCAVEDPKLGQEMLPLLFVPQMLFAGFFVTPELIPVWLRWAQYLCSLTYAVRLGLVEEFIGTSSCTGEAEKTCNTVVSNVGANPDDTWWYWLVLACIFCVFRLGALAILRYKATKFY